MFIGVDIGGTNVKMGIVSKMGRILASTSFKTNIPRSPENLIDEIVVNINNLLTKSNLTLKDVEGVGFGVPGLIDTKNGIIIKAGNLNWEKVDFVKLFKNKMNLPVKMENDANCALLGESRFGGAREYKNAILITLGTGIGSGIMLDGKLLSGNGCNGECGHMVIQVNGEQCACGQRGCWERYASSSALTRRTIEAAKQNPDSKLNDIIKKWNGKVSAITTFNAAKMGDAVAKQLVDDYINYISTGLISLAWIFHPEVFVIGGGIAKEGANFIAPIQQKLDNFVKENNFYPSIAVKKTVLEDNLGIVGAASLMMG